MKSIDNIKKDINDKDSFNSKFLSEEEQVQFKKYKNVKFIPQYCERKRLVDDSVIDTSEYINVLQVSYNKKFGHIGHRDVLGALIGLGIKRECIGDIIIDENIYIYITKEMKQFVLENLIKIGSVYVSLEEVEIESIKDLNNNNYIEDTLIVSSYRLDTIISERCSLSREKAKQYISLKNVKINGIINNNPDYIVKIDDLVSIHKYGRLIIKEQIKITKKNNYVLRVFKTK